MSKQAVQFLLAIVVTLCVMVALICGVSINLAMASGTGWMITSCVIIGGPILVAGFVCGRRVWLFGFGAVVAMTLIIWLITHAHISVS